MHITRCGYRYSSSWCGAVTYTCAAFVCQCTAGMASWNRVIYQKLQEVHSEQQVALRCEALHRCERMVQDHVQQVLVALCRHEAHAITEAALFYTQ